MIVKIPISIVSIVCYNLYICLYENIQMCRHCMGPSYGIPSDENPLKSLTVDIRNDIMITCNGVL